MSKAGGGEHTSSNSQPDTRYVIGENKPDEPEFKFIYYTGKTLQNT